MVIVISYLFSLLVSIDVGLHKVNGSLFRDQFTHHYTQHSPEPIGDHVTKSPKFRPYSSHACLTHINALRHHFVVFEQFYGSNGFVSEHVEVPWTSLEDGGHYQMWMYTSLTLQITPSCLIFAPLLYSSRAAAILPTNTT